jgi:thiamine-phosphate pyrophosphorylase
MPSQANPRPKQAEPRPAPRIYLITPPIDDASAFVGDLAAALEAADVAAVLLRLADGDERSLINRIKTLAPAAQQNGAALLLDGHPELVARGGADGSHLTGIAAFSAAVDRLKPERIAGAGGLATRDDVMVAAEAGAVYGRFGAPDASATATEERIAWAAELFELPCIAYANHSGEIAPFVSAGADFIALDFVWRDPRGTAAALAEASQYLRLPEPA